MWHTRSHEHRRQQDFSARLLLELYTYIPNRHAITGEIQGLPLHADWGSWAWLFPGTPAFAKRSICREGVTACGSGLSHPQLQPKADAVGEELHALQRLVGLP